MIKYTWGAWSRTFYLSLDRDKVPDAQAVRSFLKAGKLPHVTYRTLTRADLDFLNREDVGNNLQNLGALLVESIGGDWSYAGSNAASLADFPSHEDPAKQFKARQEWFMGWPLLELQRFMNEVEADSTPGEDLEGNSEASSP